MIVLGIETSCDETSIAVVENGKKVLSNIVYSQIDIHKKFGGVVPEVASRHHIQKVTLVFEEALKQANIKPSQIDLVAVTSHPGLIGSLLVGINAAKAFALCHNIKVIEVDHIKGHIYANYLESDFYFPVLALVVSGGHTELIVMKDHLQFDKIGETMDDAVGEAYDKVGRVMGLDYPAGVLVDNLAQQGKPSYKLPVYNDMSNYNFSFSGLKSAVINLLNTAKMKNEEVIRQDLCCSFQDAVVKVLVNKTIQAVKHYNIRHVVVAGGVAANSGLRLSLKKEVSELDNVLLTFPSMRYCTDNAAMIAVYGFFKYNIQGNS